VSRIVLVAGTYEFADDMCSNYLGGSALCIDCNVTIEAEVAGSVVLDAKGARRVIYVSATGRAQLFGLNITGGATESNGGGILIDAGWRYDGTAINGTAMLTDTNVYENRADGFGGGARHQGHGSADRHQRV